LVENRQLFVTYPTTVWRPRSGWPR